MIVLTLNQKSFLDSFLNDYREQMALDGLSIEPVEIKNSLWILPESVLEDPRCAKAYKALVDGGHLANMVTREVSEDELIQTTL